MIRGRNILFSMQNGQRAIFCRWKPGMAKFWCSDEVTCYLSLGTCHLSLVCHLIFQLIVVFVSLKRRGGHRCLFIFNGMSPPSILPLNCLSSCWVEKRFVQPCLILKYICSTTWEVQWLLRQFWLLKYFYRMNDARRLEVYLILVFVKSPNMCIPEWHWCCNYSTAGAE